MKNTNTRSGNIFESIKKEEEKEEKAKNNAVETNIKSEKEVKSAIKKPESLAKTNDQPKTAKNQASDKIMAETTSKNPGINYLKEAGNEVDEPVNNGLLYITPTRKKTRSHRKGFLLSDLALKNLQNEAAKYEISENELINQILEKMV
ncbi:MAG: hypothetical protein PUF16_07560 [Lachnospiraceae bacterium]|nr:hypothetical protein [Lachnospiraceae bacterium]